MEVRRGAGVGVEWGLSNGEVVVRAGAQALVRGGVGWVLGEHGGVRACNRRRCAGHESAGLNSTSCDIEGEREVRR